MPRNCKDSSSKKTQTNWSKNVGFILTTKQVCAVKPKFEILANFYYLSRCVFVCNGSDISYVVLQDVNEE